MNYIIEINVLERFGKLSMIFGPRKKYICWYFLWDFPPKGVKPCYKLFLHHFSSSHLLLISVVAGGVGLNIVEANHIGFLDRWYHVRHFLEVSFLSLYIDLGHLHGEYIRNIFILCPVFIWIHYVQKALSNFHSMNTNGKFFCPYIMPQRIWTQYKDQAVDFTFGFVSPTNQSKLLWIR